MLKLKDNINIKDLKKYLEKNKKNRFSDDFFIDKENKEIRIRCSDSWYEDEINASAEILYDLIKADFIEKINN